MPLCRDEEIRLRCFEAAASRDKLDPLSLAVKAYEWVSQSQAEEAAKVREHYNEIRHRLGCGGDA